MTEIGFWGILAPFLPRLRDLGVIIVGIIEAHVHTYFGHFSLVLSSFRFSCHFWPCLTELADFAKTGLGKNIVIWPHKNSRSSGLVFLKAESRP